MFLLSSFAYLTTVLRSLRYFNVGGRGEIDRGAPPFVHWNMIIMIKPTFMIVFVGSRLCLFWNVILHSSCPSGSPGQKCAPVCVGLYGQRRAPLSILFEHSHRSCSFNCARRLCILSVPHYPLSTTKLPLPHKSSNLIVHSIGVCHRIHFVAMC